MGARRLTGRFCELVKPTPRRQVEYPDAAVGGLAFRVSPKGMKTWTLRYRLRSGRQRRITLGRFTAMCVATARATAIETLRTVTDGSDPAAKRRTEKKKARILGTGPSIQTFGELAAMYFSECEQGLWKPRNRRKRPRTVRAERAIYRRYLEKPLAAIELGEVTRPVVKKLLRSLVAAGIQAQTNRAQAVIRQIFAYGISEDYCQINPATGFARFGEEMPRARALSDEELKQLWAGLVSPAQLRDGNGDPIRLSRPVAIILQLAMLLLQRRSEIAGMRLSELNFAQATWLIG